MATLLLTLDQFSHYELHHQAPIGEVIKSLHGCLSPGSDSQILWQSIKRAT
jgi:hypothetical protein